MNRIIQSLLFAGLFLSFIAVGCQSNPTSPAAVDPEDVIVHQSAAQASTHNCLGYYMLTVDMENLELEMLPLRSSEWHFNLTGVLNGTMGVSAAGVPSEHDPANGLFVFDITLAHPFDTSPQLAGFDVKGVLITPGSLVLGANVFADVDDVRLENADGYTRWWNPTEFTSPGMLGYTEGILASAPGGLLAATVNPYKYFADILYPISSLGAVCYEPLDSDQGRGVFTAGESNTRRYEIRFPMPGPVVKYGYAIDCSWNPPVPNPPAEVPDDFPINANQPEAYRVALYTTADSLYYDSNAGVGGGVLRLEIAVFDWQGQAVGNIPPEINAVRIYAPDLMTGGVDAILQSHTTEKVVYSIDLTGTAIPSEPGDTLIICRVGSSDGSTYQQTAMPAPDAPLSAYQVLELEVPDVVCAPDGNNDFAEAEPISIGESITSQVCVPDDVADFYTFNFDPGEQPIGEIRLYCDVESCKLGLYDEFHKLITEGSTCGGTGIFNLDNYTFMPTSNYIKVSTTCVDQVVPYFLELDAGLVDVMPDVPSTEVTPDWLYCNPEKVWNAHSYWILTGPDGCWVYKKNFSNDFDFIFHEDWNIGPDACYYNPKFFYIENTGSVYGKVNYIDFSDPENPVHYDNVIDAPVALHGICTNGTHLFVGKPNFITTPINIYSITDPTHPVMITTIPNTDNSEMLKLMNPHGPNKKLITYENDIRVFDIDDLENITADGNFIPGSGIITDMYIDFYTIYYTHFNTATDQGSLHVLEHNTVIPNDLAEVGWINLPGEAESIYSWSPNVFIADGMDGLTICNVDDPANIEIESTTPLVSNCVHLGVYGDMVCAIPEGAGMQAFDVDPPDNPVLLATIPVVNAPRMAVMQDDHLFVGERAGYHYAVKSVDISDPPNAEVVDIYNLTDYPRVMAVGGNKLAVCSSYQCYLLNVTDPESISWYDTFSLNFNPTAAEIIGNNVLYITISSQNLLVYDISSPYSPSLEGSPVVSAEVNDIEIGDGYMYLATANGVDVWDISSPLAPVFETHYSTSAELMELAVQRNYLNMVTPTTYEIAQISDPSSPVYSGDLQIDPLLELTEIDVAGQFAYVQGATSGAYACWVWPPNNPTVHGVLYDQNFLSFFGLSTELIVDDGFIYGMTQYDGMRIHELY